LLLVGGLLSLAARAEVLVLSRHSGEILEGQDAPLPVSAEARALLGVLGSSDSAPTVRALAEAARVKAAALGVATVEARGPGWRVDLDQDRVVFREGPDLDRALPPRSRAAEASEVQVFGLVGAERVQVQCPGTAMRIVSGVAERVTSEPRTLARALGQGLLLCTGGSWEVRVAGSAPRPYAGIFLWSPAPDRLPEPGATPREARARRGSDVLFRTTLAAYVAGVVNAEDARLTGEARLALAQVVAHDAGVPRHPGRPLCDTTHCQAFLGTAIPGPEEMRALSLPPLPSDRWLPYSRGGAEPWTVRRTSGQVQAVLRNVRGVRRAGAQLEVTTAEGVHLVDCEPVRAALRLPRCPSEVALAGSQVVFRGTGRGHGLGLDVEAARRSGLPATVLLERAYGLRGAE
jgi:hypothetical protein